MAVVFGFIHCKQYEDTVDDRKQQKERPCAECACETLTIINPVGAVADERRVGDDLDPSGPDREHQR